MIARSFPIPPFPPPALMILFLFLSHLGVGIVLTLVFVSREAGVKFFRFNAGLAAILIAIALAFRYQGLGGFGPGGGWCGLEARSAWSRSSSPRRRSSSTGRRSAACSPGSGRRSRRSPSGGGVLAVVLQAVALTAGDTVPMQLLTAVSFVSSAALLGSTCTAMILGHWYLVIPSLEVRHLQSIVKVHIASLVFRIVVVGAAVFAGIALWEAGPAASASMTASFRRYITSVDGIFFWQRVLFGLAGPAVLSYLTWETAKIRSTQSATGILYVDFFTVVVGEVLAKYLVLATRVPL